MFCCSEHLLPTDFIRTLTCHRRDLKAYHRSFLGQKWMKKRLKLRCEKSEGITRAESAHENKDQEEIAEDFQKDSVV